MTTRDARNTRSTRRWPVLLAAGAMLIASLGLAPAAHAQSRDYLLGTPPASLTLRGGVSVLRQNSDIFEHTREFLTVGRGDLLGGSAALDLGIRLSDRFDLVGSVGVSHSSTWSEFHDWVDDQGLPIEQQTWLTQVPATLGLKVYPLERGRSVGRLAYIPSRVAPYVGVAGGTVWHRFAQEGDFLDTIACEEWGNCAIVPGRLESSGFAPAAQLFGGAELRVLPRLSIALDARYQWARAPMGRDFEGFDRIDLSGFQTTVGINIRL